MILSSVEQSVSSDPSPWTTVGLPLIIVALAQVGAYLVARTTSSAQRAADSARYLRTEVRHAYAAHLAAANEYRMALSKAMTARVVPNLSAITFDDAWKLVTETYRVHVSAGHEARLLGSDSYLAAADVLDVALGEMMTKSLNAEPAEDANTRVRLITEWSSVDDRITDLRNVARTEIRR